MALHTIVEHDTTHIKPYIDAKIQDVNSDIQTLLNYEIKNGVKNIVPNNFRGTCINQGITYIGNTDGSILVKAGTVASHSNCYLLDEEGLNTNLLYPIDKLDRNKDYTISIITDSSVSIKYYFQMYDANGNSIASPRANSLSPTASSTFKIANEDPNNLAVWYKTFLRIDSGTTVPADTVVYTMLREAWITDSAYEPYAKSNTELTKDTKGLTDNEFANGCVNLLDTDVSSSVLNGLTITVNNDKSIKINGTATADTQIILQKGGNNTRLFRDGILQTGKRYKISGCPNGGNTNTYKIVFNYIDANNTVIHAVDLGEGDILNVPQAALGGNVMVSVFNGTTLSNAVFKPMITLADVPNSDYAHYVPYAKSNKELTEDTTPKAITFTPTDSSKANMDWGEFVKVGNLVMGTVAFTVNDVTTGTEISLGTLPYQPMNSKAIPVVDTYGRNEFAGYIMIVHDTNTLKYLPTETVNQGRICGTLIFLIR